MPSFLGGVSADVKPNNIGVSNAMLMVVRTECFMNQNYFNKLLLIVMNRKNQLNCKELVDRLNMRGLISSINDQTTYEFI